MAHPNFMEKTFTGGSKTAEFENVFTLESFLLYSYIIITIIAGYINKCNQMSYTRRYTGINVISLPTVALDHCQTLPLVGDVYHQSPCSH